MLSRDELIKLESNISDKTESDIQDNARINIIDQLSAQGFYTEAENIIFKLNSTQSEMVAKEIILKNRKLWIRKTDDYTQAITRNQPLQTNNIVIEESYDAICKYIESKKNSLTTDIISHIKNRIGNLPDQSGKKALSSMLTRYIQTYKIYLRQQIIKHKEDESNRIKKLDESREKYLKWQSEISDVLASMTKKEKSLYLDSELSLHWLISVVSRKKKKPSKKKKPYVKTDFPKSERKKLFKAFRSL